MNATTRYPEIEVRLTGTDGNVYALLSACVRAMRRAALPRAEIEAFRVEVIDSNSYDMVLQTMMRWFTIS